MKLLSPKAYYHTVGKKAFFEFVLLTVFLLFFYLPILNLTMLAFGEKYEAPAVFPQQFGFKWWHFVLGQPSLVSSIVQSLVFAVVTTLVSAAICIPAAYALARFQFPGRRFVQLSLLFSNAFPKMGLYISIGILYYKLNLMGTFVGVVLIHVLNSLMFMTWIPSNAFLGVHRQQEESAKDAGASPFQTFLHVTFPLAMPSIIVASIYTFLGSFEEAQGTMLVGFPKFRTLPVELYGIIMEYATTAGPVFSLILLIPTIALLVVFRKYLGADTISKGFKLK